MPLAFHALGRRSESDAALAALKGKYAGEAAYQIAEVHAFRGEVDLAFEWLERAYDQRDGGVAEIKGDRLMRGLVGDPRYKAFLEEAEAARVRVPCLTSAASQCDSPAVVGSTWTPGSTVWWNTSPDSGSRFAIRSTSSPGW